MKYFVSIDSFKNTLKSSVLNNIVKKQLKNCLTLPIADGGENTLDSLIYQHSNLKRMYINTVNAYYKKIKTYILIDEKIKTAYVEVAKVLSLKVNKKLNPFIASSFGVGLIIDYLSNIGIKIIYLCLGGTITNDLGLGMLEALGVRFYQKDLKLINQVNLNKINDIYKVDFKSLLKYQNIKFYILSDVKNKLLGYKGTTYFFGPQKGIKKNQLKYIESNIKKFLLKIEAKNYAKKGSGAAGGIGFAAIEFLKAKYFSGIDYLLKYHNVINKIQKCDIIITGEGQVDQQSFNGKVISGFLKFNKPIIVLCAKTLIKKDNIFQINDYFSMEDSIKYPKKYFQDFINILIEKNVLKKEL